MPGPRSSSRLPHGHFSRALLETHFSRALLQSGHRVARTMFFLSSNASLHRHEDFKLHCKHANPAAQTGNTVRILKHPFPRYHCCTSCQQYQESASTQPRQQSLSFIMRYGWGEFWNMPSPIIPVARRAPAHAPQTPGFTQGFHRLHDRFQFHRCLANIVSNVERTQVCQNGQLGQHVICQAAVLQLKRSQACQTHEGSEVPIIQAMRTHSQLV